MNKKELFALLFTGNTDTQAKMVRLALSILRPIQGSIRPFSSSLNLTVDEYDNEWNDKKHVFLELSRALLDISQAPSDLTQAYSNFYQTFPKLRQPNHKWVF